MATIPVVLALPPVIDLLRTEVIPFFVKLIDRVVGGKTTANPAVGTTTKFPLAQTLTAAFAAVLVAIGQASPSSDAAMQGAIQDIVNKLDAAGVLVGHATVVTPAAIPAVSGFDANSLLSGILSLVARELGPKNQG